MQINSNKMKRKVWFHVAVVFCLGLLACQSDDEKFEEASKEVVFRVVNYTQYNLDEVTRASADVLDHLVLGVFDAESNAMVGSLITQDKGADGYGTFKVKLPVGQYRLVFLGYVGSSTFNMSSPTLVTFANDAVPTTFSYSTTLTVGHDQIEAQNIVLKRAFGAFRVTLTDVIPSGVATMRFRSVGGSTKLNGQTGYAADNSGRTFSVSIPTSYIGKEDVKLTLNLFLPEGETKMSIALDALDSDGTVLRTRTFTDVPMMVNRLINYSGAFFSNDFSATVTVDDEWESEPTVNF